MADGHEVEGLLEAQTVEVVRGDRLAVENAFALESENAIFQLSQAAALEAGLPQAARSVQQVEVRQTREGRSRSGHAVAGFEQRNVVGLAVVGDQDIEAAEVVA